MTTIIGLQERDLCVIGADSQTSNDGRAFTSALQPKIINVGEYLIAPAGSGAACDVLMHQWRPPVQREHNPYRHVVTTVIPSIRRAFNEHDVSIGGEETFEALIAFQGHLFEIATDLTVLVRDDGIHGIGTGAAYAIGALHMGATVIEALEIAAINDIYTSGPMIERTQTK